MPVRSFHEGEGPLDEKYQIAFCPGKRKNASVHLNNNAAVWVTTFRG